MKPLLCLIILIFLYTSAYAQNVGIGYSSPYGKLTIGHNVLSSSPTLALFQGTAAGGPRIHLNNAGGTATWIIYGNIDNAIAGNSVLGFAYANEAMPVLTILGNSRVGINQPTPNFALDVTGDINLTGALRINGSAGSNGQVLTSDGTTSSWRPLPPAGGSEDGFTARVNGTVSLANAVLTTITSFLEVFDDGNNFDNTTGIYTAPSDGVYVFHVQANLTLPISGTARYSVRYQRNGAIFAGCQAFSVVPGDIAGTNTGLSHSVCLKLVTGDQVSFQVSQNCSSPTTLSMIGNGTTANSMFSGYKIY